MSSMDWEQVCKISRDYAIKGVEVMAQLPRDAGKAFRFTYVSGTAASRDKKPWIYGEYSMMRVRDSVPSLLSMQALLTSSVFL